MVFVRSRLSICMWKKRDSSSLPEIDSWLIASCTPRRTAMPKSAFLARPHKQVTFLSSYRMSLLCLFHFKKHLIFGHSVKCYAGLSEINGAKFRELSLSFPKLVDWLCTGWPSCLAALRLEFSNRGHFFCTTLYNKYTQGEINMRLFHFSRFWAEVGHIVEC